MVLVIDNYDSFTFNLVHLLGYAGAQCDVRRNDSLTVRDAIATDPECIVISPGPCTPAEAGICLDLIAAAAGRFPILGVCLGHQAIGQAFGGVVTRADSPMHGKVSAVNHDSKHLFAGLANPLKATRYHSLIVENHTLPEVLEANAYSEDGVIMAIRHRVFPIFGVQFHPESIASQSGLEILMNFLAISRCGGVPGRSSSIS